PESTSSTCTASGSSTRLRARNSTSSRMLLAHHTATRHDTAASADAGLTEEIRDAIGRLGALAQPLAGFFAVDLHGGWIGARVVMADDIDREAVARGI